MKLRYGIISCATIVDRFIHAVQAYGDEVVAIAARDIKRAEEKAKHHHINKAYGTYHELYQDVHVDIVYIATNNANHIKEITNALQHGKHVICEKPIVLLAQECKDIFQIAKQNQCFLMEAQKSLFLPITKKIKEIVQQHTLGKLHQVEMSSSFKNPTASWMHDSTQGGVVYGSASYTLEYLDYIIEPTNTFVSAIGFMEENGTCERVSMNLKYDDVLINSRISMHGDTLHHAIFYFEQGYIKVPSYWKASSCIVYHGKEKQTYEFPIAYEMIYEVAHIHECITQGRLQSDVMHQKRSIQCVEIVEKIIQQLQNK